MMLQTKGLTLHYGGSQILYGIDGEPDIDELVLDHLAGYDGARPVRIDRKSVV